MDASATPMVWKDWPVDHPQWRDARNVLVVRLDNLGDVLMTTPAINAIKQHSPDMRVTLLSSRSGAAVAKHVPCIDEAIVYAAPWVKGGAGGDLVDRRLLATLRRRNFDAVVIFTARAQSALPAAMMMRLAGIRLRLAYSRENPHDLLTDWVPDEDTCSAGMRHEVARQLGLVRSVGFQAANDQLVFEQSAADVLNMRRKLTAAGGDPARPYIVAHPGATAASRRYPTHRFARAADLIGLESGCQVVFSGGRDEQALVGAALRQMEQPALSMAGSLTLGELAALIDGAQLTVCNNSGPAHIAAALGKPVVALYALGSPQQDQGRLMKLTPEQVAAAGLQLIHAQQRGAPPRRAAACDPPRLTLMRPG